MSTSWSAVNYLMRSGSSWSGRERNSCYFNLGGGRFANMSYVSGVGYADDGRGVAPVDWDGDGDLDLWMNNRNSPKVRFMRNDYEGGNHHLAVKLTGDTCNRDAIGARIEVHLAGGGMVMGTVRAGVNYTMQGTKWVHFGLGRETRIDNLTVRWPGGEPTVYRNIRADRRYEIKQNGGAPTPAARTPAAPLASARLDVPPASATASVPLGVAMPVPPSLGLTDFDGNRIELGDLVGTPVLINFWASWCTGCMAEFGDLADHRAQIEQSGVKILACSVDEPDGRAAAVATTKRFGFWFPAGFADEEMMNFVDVLKDAVFDQYEDLPLPSSFLIDESGRLARIYRGPCEANQLVADVQLLRDARSDIDRLFSASQFRTGYWAQPDAWIESIRGNQLLSMTKFLAAAGRLDLLAFYANTLGDFVNERERPRRAMLKALGALQRAAMLLGTTRPGAAADIYRRLIAADGENAGVLFRLTAVLLAAGDPATRDEAVEAFEKALSITGDPQTPEGWYTYGVTYYELGMYVEAVPYLERAAVETPDRSDVHQRLGKTLDLAGRRNEAVPHYERAIALVGEAKTIGDHAMLARSYLRLQNWSGAIPHLEAVLAEDPSRDLDRSVLGRALVYAGRHSEALEHLERALPNLPPDPSSEYLLGMVRAKVGRLGEAVENFRLALQLKPEYRDAVRALVQTYIQLGRGNQIAAVFQAYFEKVPADADTMLHMEGVFAERPALAIPVYRNVIRVAPATDFARHRLSWLLATAPSASDRDGVESLRLAEDLVARVGRNAMLLDGLAAAFAEIGRFDEAVRAGTEALEQVRESQPNLAEAITARVGQYQQRRPYRLP